MANFGGGMLTTGVDAPYHLRWKKALHGFSRQMGRHWIGKWVAGTAMRLAIGVLGLDDDFYQKILIAQ